MVWVVGIGSVAPESHLFSSGVAVGLYVETLVIG